MSRPQVSIFLLALLALLAVNTGFASAEEPPEETGEEQQAPSTKEQSEDSSSKNTEGKSRSVYPEHPKLALPDEVVPMLLEDALPKRTAPLVEWGQPLLGPGKLGRGIELPTGAVWSPSLWVFGSYRTSINSIDPWPADTKGADELIEWAHRLDLFLNLQLSGTERLVFGLRPFNRGGKFTTYTHSPEAIEGWQDELNLDLNFLFFEGDFGEIFPRIDPTDRKGLDIGFAVGRQKIEFQDGIMFNDQIDSIGVTRNSLTMPGVSNLRTTFLVGWNDIHRDNNVEDEKAGLVGVFIELDTRHSTIEVDAAWVSSDDKVIAGGDGLYLGVGATQRFGFLSTTFRGNSSWALDRETDAVSDGTLLTAQFAISPRGSHNVVYSNLFWGIDRYSSAARDPTTGGPLGGTGLLFAAVGLGRFRPALGNRADNSWGGSLGYQLFFDHDRTQLVLEVGGRESTKNGPSAWAYGTRFQRKLGRRWLFQADGYVTHPESGGRFVGLRSEIQVKF
jgi:hypothetical protein